MIKMLLLLPQRYIFSSKSQQSVVRQVFSTCCCCYHKGTYFQANHNDNNGYADNTRVVVATTKVHIFKQITTWCSRSCCIYYVVVATTKVHIFKQITTSANVDSPASSCCCYHKGTYFQANHNYNEVPTFKLLLLLLPQRYIFSSKSQQKKTYPGLIKRCCCYHKGTYFQANHNTGDNATHSILVVVATTKVHIFKQITTCLDNM